MTDDNKKTLITYAKVLALLIYAMMTIMTCSAVWSSKPGVFLSIVAGALFATNAYIIAREGIKLWKGDIKD
jgi:hypothetical protein